MSDVKVLQISNLSALLNCILALLSFGLDPLPLSSSSWQISYNSGIYNIFGSPLKLSSPSHFHAMDSMPPYRNTLDTCRASAAFLSFGGILDNSFFCITDSKPEPLVAETAKFNCLVKLELDSFVHLHLHQISS